MSPHHLLLRIASAYAVIFLADTLLGLPTHSPGAIQGAMPTNGGEPVHSLTVGVSRTPCCAASLANPDIKKP